MRNKVFHILFYTILLIGSGSLCIAQSVSVKADKYKALIGQHLQIEITTPINSGESIVWADLSQDTLGSFEIINRGKIDTLIGQNGASDRLQQKFIVTCFTPGMQKFPKLPFQVSVAGSEQLKSFFSDELLIEISTVQVDTTEQIKEIKDIMAAPFDIDEWLPWIGLAALALLLIALGIWWYLKRKEKIAPTIAPVPAIPPYEILIASLKRIKQEELWKQGYLKKYYSEVADSLRVYIEDEWKVRALELTSDEILGMLKSNPRFDTSFDDLRLIFKKADLVKFAKHKPLDQEHIELIERAFKVADLLEQERQKMKSPANEEGGAHG